MQVKPGFIDEAEGTVDDMRSRPAPGPGAGLVLRLRCATAGPGIVSHGLVGRGGL